MKEMLKRLAGFGILQLVLLELTLQFCVHRRESTEETLVMALMAFVFVGAIWIVRAAYLTAKYRNLWRTLTFLPVLALLYNADYYYSWHVRPKLSFYRQPDWVIQGSQHQDDVQRALDAGGK